jgi:hypothetical protein
MTRQQLQLTSIWMTNWPRGVSGGHGIAATRTFTVRNEKLSCTGISLDRLCTNCPRALELSTRISRWSGFLLPQFKDGSLSLLMMTISWRWCGNENRKAKLFMCLTNWAITHEDVWRSGYIDQRFLDLGTGGSEWLASHLSVLPLYTRLWGPQSWSLHCGEENILDPTGTRTSTPWSSSP